MTTETTPDLNEVANGILNNRPISFEAADSIQDVLITKVAGQMWEKELEQKFKNPYCTQWSVNFSKYLTTVKNDVRKDDGVLTPKKIKEIDIRRVTNPKPTVKRVDMYPNQFHNIISNYPIEQYEENEAPPPKLDTYGGK